MTQIIKPPIDEVFAKINDIIPYIDRVKVWYEENNPRFDVDVLKKTCGGAKGIPGVMTYKDKSGKRKKNWQWQYKLDLLQPSIKAFQHLNQPENKTVKRAVNYIEVALDFITETKEDAKFIHGFFDLCWVKRWHGNSRTLKTDKGGTTYSGQGATTNQVTYSSKRSKMTGFPCCHLEIRLVGMAACRNAGYSQVENLIDINFNEFWRKYLHLREVKDIDKIRKIIERKYSKLIRNSLQKKSNRQKSSHRNMFLNTYDKYVDWLLQHHIRLGTDGFLRNSITAQLVQDGWTHIKKNCLIKIDSERFLPKG